jgi:hypothetical protein
MKKNMTKNCMDFAKLLSKPFKHLNFSLVNFRLSNRQKAVKSLHQGITCTNCKEHETLHYHVIRQPDEARQH